MLLRHGTTWAAWLLLVITASTARADVTLPAIIGDHMVLQRDVPLPIWGWAAPGEEVRVSIGDNTASAKADELGKWQVTLKPLKVGEPVEMTIAGKNTIKVTDILVGEVWLGSGQSNMQWSVSASDNPKEEASAATFPKIRLFSVPLVPSGTPAHDVNAKWQVCSPETVPNFSAVAYYFGRELHRTLELPVGMIASSWGGTRIEPWIPPVGFASQKELAIDAKNVENQNAAYAKSMARNIQVLRPWLDQAEKALAAGKDVPPPPTLPPHPLNSNGAATGLYNGMIHPLVPFAIRGALWYQGESNMGQGMQYHTLMKGLIAGWRNVWNQGDFPFLYVQLAPFRYGNKETSLPEIWEAQAATLAVPNTGMAVITDIGNVADIHPRNKQDVGKRLAFWALNKTYNKSDVVYSGPLYESMSVELDQVQIKFKHGDGLKSRDGKPLTWFTIAGEDRKFVPATATISGDKLIVRANKVTQPVAVRFGWSHFAEPNLANGAGLPASPFRTDKWDTLNANDPAFPTLK